MHEHRRRRLLRHDAVGHPLAQRACRRFVAFRRFTFRVRDAHDVVGAPLAERRRFLGADHIVGRRPDRTRSVGRTPRLSSFPTNRSAWCISASASVENRESVKPM